MWVGMAEHKGLPGAGAGSNRFGYPRNTTYIGAEGKDQRQQQKKQEFCLHFRQVMRTLISIKFFLVHMILMYLIVY